MYYIDALSQCQGDARKHQLNAIECVSTEAYECTEMLTLMAIARHRFSQVV